MRILHSKKKLESIKALHNQHEHMQQNNQKKKKKKKKKKNATKTAPVVVRHFDTSASNGVILPQLLEAY